MTEQNKGIIRVQKNRENPYVMIHKGYLEDENLSFKAKGILTYLLSKPDNWKVIVGDLIKRSKDGEKAVRSGLNELKENGYLQKYPVYQNKKIVRWDSIVYETPFIEEERIKHVILDSENVETTVLAQKVKVDKVKVGKVEVEKRQRNNNDLNNKDYNNNLSQSVPDRPTESIESINNDLSKTYGEDILKAALEIMKHHTVSKKGYKSYLTKICKEQKEIMSSAPKTKKNSFHPEHERTSNYSSKGLEDLLRNKKR